VRTITINPKGTAHFNAVPWAEVWLEGTKLGDTPLAGIQVPLGTRDFVFKHPQYGEKRITVTVRGNGPSNITHDFTKE
jgi:PEGA domain